MSDIIERVARAIAQELVRQDGNDEPVVFDAGPLTLSYVDQNHVEFGLIAAAAIEATNYTTLETALRTIQSAVPKYLKKQMTAEEFALVCVGEVDNAKVNKALEKGR